MQLDDFPRSRFCHLPTPLEPLAALAGALGGPRLLVKRDDCTGLAFGGNKTRKLEFLVAEALAAGADTLVTAGGVQSNHCRQTAAVAARHGLRCELVLSRNVARNTPGYDRTGNVLLDRLFGATLHFVAGNADFATELERVAASTRERGARPFVIPIGGSTPTGRSATWRAARSFWNRRQRWAPGLTPSFTAPAAAPPRPACCWGSGKRVSASP